MSDRLAHTLSGRWSGVALLRALYWRHLRRYDSEVCHDCGRPVGRCTGSWWHSDLWMEVVGSDGGVVCPPCFTARADAKGIHIYWRGVLA